MREASDELHVTPSAITHSIKLLEERLGVTLLMRDKGQLTLTTVGANYHLAIQKALKELEVANLEFAANVDQSETLNLTTSSTFATLWLGPRLPLLLKKAPDIHIALNTVDSILNLSQENVDIAIRYGDQQIGENISQLLFKDSIIPVCSKAYLQKQKGKTDIAQLNSQFLIHHEMDVGWNDWIASTNHKDVADSFVDTSAGIHFDRSYMAIQAAMCGVGITLASKPLVASALQTGQLVKPFSHELNIDASYYLVHRKAKVECKNVAFVINWMLDNREC